MATAQNGGYGGNWDYKPVEFPCEDPEVGWRERVAFADDSGGGFAYRRYDVLTTQPEPVRDIAVARWGDVGIAIDERKAGDYARVTNIPDPLWVIDEARAQGIDAHPNHVLFLHSGYMNPASMNPASMNPASMNPASMNPASMNPASMNPASMNPASMNPASMNPASMNPGWGDCCGPVAYATNAGCVSVDERRARETGYRPSSARPATLTGQEAQALQQRVCAGPVRGGPTVYVLDTGLAHTDWQPMLCDANAVRPGPGADNDQPDADGDPDDALDCVAGHATFIAGIIKQISPAANVSVHRVASVLGDADEFEAARIIRCLPSDENTILNCSFGGSAMDDEARALASAIRDFQARGGVVVASAGNESTHRRQYPAALRDVVSVGALGPCGPAPFTNYGGWVRACAPGFELRSIFFKGFGPTQLGGETHEFVDGFAKWSGTSFAAPVVVGALARMMRTGQWCSAPVAVERVIDAPELLRLPYLGTVVNVSL